MVVPPEKLLSVFFRSFGVIGHWGGDFGNLKLFQGKKRKTQVPVWLYHRQGFCPLLRSGVVCGVGLSMVASEKIPGKSQKPKTRYKSTTARAFVHFCFKKFYGLMGFMLMILPP